MSKQCDNCGYQNVSEAQFCSSCGANLDSSIQCVNCQARNAADAQFCYRCGQALAADSSAGRPAAIQQPIPEAFSGYAPNVSAQPGVHGSGWQPVGPAQPRSTDSRLGRIPPTESHFSHAQVPTRTGFPWKKLILSVPGLFMVPVLFVFLMHSIVPFSSGMGLAVRFLLIGGVPGAFLFWVWRGRGNNHSVLRGNETMQGEVRAFGERQELNATQTAMDTIWSFRLERYQDGRRLPPIPVEIRGQRFTSSINEGDTIRLLDKWRGEGVHRAKQVFNVTNGAMVQAKKVGLSIWMKLWIVFLGACIAAFVLFLVVSF